MKNTNAFRTRAKDEIVKLEKDTYGRDVTHEEIEIVSLTYVMGFIKGMFVVAKNTQGRIYEISSNPITNRLYIDVYKKEATNYKNMVFPIFTNGTFVNNNYLDLFDNNRNLVPIVSIEGEKNMMI